MAFKMRGNPFKQKLNYKEGEDYTDKDGNKWVWSEFDKIHHKVDIDLTGVPAEYYNREIARQDPDFKFPKGEDPTKKDTASEEDE